MVFFRKDKVEIPRPQRFALPRISIPPRRCTYRLTVGYLTDFGEIAFALFRGKVQRRLLFQAFHVVFRRHSCGFLEGHEEWVAALESTTLCKGGDGKGATVWLLGQLHEGFDAIFGNEVVVAAVQYLREHLR